MKVVQKSSERTCELTEKSLKIYMLTRQKWLEKALIPENYEQSHMKISGVFHEWFKPRISKLSASILVKFRFALVESEVDPEGFDSVDKISNSQAIVFCCAARVDLTNFASHTSYFKPTKTALS